MKTLLLSLLISVPSFANARLNSAGGSLISKEAFDRLSSCEKKVLAEVIRILRKDELDRNGNIVLGQPYLLWTEITFSSIKEEFDTYSFKKRFPQYFPWQVVFKATAKDTRDGYRVARGDKFGFEVLTTLPKKRGFLSADKDCQIIDYKTDPHLVQYFEVESGISKDSNRTARFFSLTNF
jgi:hypothetical protein